MIRNFLGTAKLDETAAVVVGLAGARAMRIVARVDDLIGDFARDLVAVPYFLDEPA